MNVASYLNLKKKRNNVADRLRLARRLRRRANIDTPDEKEKAFEQVLANYEKQIKEAENTDSVKEYLNLIKRKARLSQQKALNERRGKDIMKIIEQINELQNKIIIFEQVEPDEQVQKTTSRIPQQTPQPIIAQPKELVYYIINLAWTSITDSIQGPVAEFMKMSNHISVTESPNMITWKYPYDTIEEMAQVKALQMCASHLLEVVKKSVGDTWKSDAEVFGKIQKY